MTTPIPTPAPTGGLRIPGVTITSSKDILDAQTKLAMLLWASGGKGKTRLAGQLHHLTQKHDGKPTLYIPLEEGEGGGAATIRKLGIPMWENIKDYSSLISGLGAIRQDKQLGGVVLDSGTFMVHKLVKPEALKYPGRDKGAPGMTRAAGVPTRSDYQVMGELSRTVLQQLLNMSAAPDPAQRKHIIVTAGDRMREDQETGALLYWGPDFPGAMADGAVQMFQLTATIEIKSAVVEGKRQTGRYLVTSSPVGAKAVKDRFEVFPAEIQIAGPDPSLGGLTLCEMWERYWLPAVAEAQSQS